MFSDEHKRNLSESIKNWWKLNKDSELTEERKKKISESLIGRKNPHKGIRGIRPDLRTGIYKICPECGKQFYCMPRLKLQIHCSWKCYVNKLKREGSHLKKSIYEHKDHYKLKQHLLKTVGKCGKCGFGDKRILELHHKDFNDNNNNKENVVLLCPNCHAVIHYEASNGMYHKKRKCLDS